jgi:prevent-host-death family protein
MVITATELKNNIGKYLLLVGDEDIIITRNGKSVAKLSSAKEAKVALAKSLFGIIPTDVTLEAARAERRSRYESFD